jgi:hypothetical protein
MTDLISSDTNNEPGNDPRSGGVYPATTINVPVESNVTCSAYGLVQPTVGKIRGFKVLFTTNPASVDDLEVNPDMILPGYLNNPERKINIAWAPARLDDSPNYTLIDDPTTIGLNDWSSAPDFLSGDIINTNDLPGNGSIWFRVRSDSDTTIFSGEDDPSGILFMKVYIAKKTGPHSTSDLKLSKVGKVTINNAGSVRFEWIDVNA